MEEYSRRKFLDMLGSLAILGTCGGMVGVSGRYLFPNVLYEPPTVFKINRPRDYPEGVNFLPDKRIFVIRRDDRIRVVSGVCTHIGCTVRWAEARSRWECPCHGSFFDANGEVMAGPAPRPLPWYGVTQAPDGRLYVDQGQVVAPDRTFTVKI